jgi:hypothetical protein
VAFFTFAESLLSGMFQMHDKPARNIEYVPPKSNAIRAFARSVCKALADRRNDPTFLEPHVVQGLAAFLQIAAQATAKHLNKEIFVDKDEK